MTATTEEVNENADIRACFTDLVKIPQTEFEKQFRSWMERDGVARALQAKLRSDLITNFNRTSLGKRIQSSTSRLTLSPIVLALNTLVSEFLFAQNCHFTLSVFCTEVPFRNTLPDFENVCHFRFKDTEITEIYKALCGTLNYDWDINNKICKNYAANASTSLLYFIVKALLEKNAESAKQKVTVATNTRFSLKQQEVAAQTSIECNKAFQLKQEKTKEEDIYDIHFKYLNKYIIILSNRVKEMCKEFECLQKQHCMTNQKPRVRSLISNNRRKFQYFNHTLERVTENLKTIASTEHENKWIRTTANAIENLTLQFQKCTTNFENISKDIKLSARSSDSYITKIEKSTSVESLRPPAVPLISANSAASQTDKNEKSYADWVHDMRYTHNGQKFLDRIEKSMLKALERQKQDLVNEMEIKLRHQRELLKIRYKQKLLEQMYTNSCENADEKREPTETISEHLKQFEKKYADLLNRIYETESECRSGINKTKQDSVPQTNPQAECQIDKKDFGVQIEPLDSKLAPSIIEHKESIQEPPKYNAADIQKQLKEVVGEIIKEERNVDQIVCDAKLRLKELEQESNQLTDNFLDYLERQRQQKLAAREAAQNLWKDYMVERDKLENAHGNVNVNDLKEIDGNLNKEKEESQQRSTKNVTFKERQSLVEICGEKFEEICSNSSNSSNLQFENPIIQARQEFFDNERKFKAEAERILGQVSNFDLNGLLPLNSKVMESLDSLKTFVATNTVNPSYFFQKSINPLKRLKNKPEMQLNTDIMTQFVSDSLSGTTTDLSALLGESTFNHQYNVHSNSLMTTERTQQNTRVNKSQQYDRIATTSKMPSAASTITTRNEIATMTLNKNNHESSKNGANGKAEMLQEHSANNCKIKSGYDHKNSQQKAWNNKYKNNNNKNQKDYFPEIAEGALSSSVQTNVLKANKSEEARKALLQQSMAKMQQLFLPHQQQQIMLDIVTKGNEENENGIIFEREKEVQSKLKLELHTNAKENKGRIKTTNGNDQTEATIVVAATKAASAAASGKINEIVVTGNKNNLQLTQTTKIKTTTQPTETSSEQRNQQNSKQQQQYFKRASSSCMGGGDSIDTMPSTDINKQLISETPSIDGDKIIEVMPDWKQIAYSTTEGYKKDAYNEGRLTNRIELGEVNTTTTTIKTGIVDSINNDNVQEAHSQLEMGELVESVAASSISVKSSISSPRHSSTASSIDLNLSMGGGIGRSSFNENDKRNTQDNDSGSDFWA